jgi:hypothetical protein
MKNVGVGHQWHSRSRSKIPTVSCIVSSIKAALSHRKLSSPGHPMSAGVLKNTIKEIAFTYKSSI